MISELLEISPLLIVAGTFFSALLSQGPTREALLHFTLAALLIMLFLAPFAKAVAKCLWPDPRPRCAQLTSLECQGMPSAHAMFAGFLTAFVAKSTRGPLWPSAVLAYSALLLWQRYQVQAHTAAQLGVGYGLGLTLGWLLNGGF